MVRGTDNTIPNLQDAFTTTHIMAVKGHIHNSTSLQKETPEHTALSQHLRLNSTLSTQSVARAPTLSRKLRLPNTLDNYPSDGHFWHSAIQPFEGNGYDRSVLCVQITVCVAAACGSKIYQGFGECFCDSYCLERGDCCLNYEEVCMRLQQPNDRAGSNVTSTTSSPTLNPLGPIINRKGKSHSRIPRSLGTNINNFTTTSPKSIILRDQLAFRQSQRQDVYECVTYQIFDSIKSGQKTVIKNHQFLTVTKCPESRDLDLWGQKQNCEDHIMDLEHITPVWDEYTGTLFKNRFCALCNVGRLFNGMEHSLKPVVWHFDCDPETENSVFEEFKSDWSNAIWVILFARCRHYLAPSDPSQEFKVCNGNIVSRCNESYRAVITNFDMLQSLCENYQEKALLYDGDDDENYTIYKNPHCAMCNGNGNKSVFCPPLGKPKGPNWLETKVSSFSIMLNLNGGMQMRAGRHLICPDEMYIDVRTSKCINFGCANKSNDLLSKECISLTSTERHFSDFKGEQFPFYLLVEYKLRENIRNVNASTLAGIQDHIVEYLRTETSLKNFTEFMFINESNNCELLFQYNFQKIYDTSFHKYYSNSQNTSCVLFKTNYSEIESQSNFMIIRENIQRIGLQLRTFLQTMDDIVGPTHISLIHDSSHVCHPTNVRGGEIDNIFATNIKNSTLYASKDDSTSNGLYIAETMFALMLEKTGKLIYPFSSSSLVLRSVVPLSTAQSSGEDTRNEYEIIEFASVCEPEILSCPKIMISSNDFQEIVSSVYNSSTPHMFLNEREVVVCSSWLAEHRSSTTRGLVENIMTLIGNGLSLVGLLFTLTTYCMFPSLRTVPGLQVMSLSLMLGMAQAMFIVNSLAATGPPWFCQVLTVLQHYAWLSAFCWMNTLAVDSLRTFGWGSLPNQKDTACRRLLKLSAYALGVPLLIVSLPLICLRQGILPLEYFQEDICWIKGWQALLYLFAIPLLVLILINVFCFVLTAMSIWRSIKNHNTLSVHKENISCFKIYWKLGCLMGITWILGYFANIEKVSFLFYAFILINTLQGVFICFAFGMNDVNIKLYRKRFSKQKETKCGRQGNLTSHSNQLSNKTTF